MIWIQIHFVNLVTHIQERGNSLKLIKPRCCSDIRQFSKSHRGIDFLSSLDESIIACDSQSSELKLDLINFCMVESSYKLLKDTHTKKMPLSFMVQICNK
jgi:hypothetical protein